MYIYTEALQSRIADRKKQQRSDVELSERLASLASDYHSTIVLRDLREVLNCAPIVPGDSSLSDTYTSNLGCFCILVMIYVQTRYAPIATGFIQSRQILVNWLTSDRYYNTDSEPFFKKKFFNFFVHFVNLLGSQ